MAAVVGYRLRRDCLPSAVASVWNAKGEQSRYVQLYSSASRGHVWWMQRTQTRAKQRLGDEDLDRLSRRNSDAWEAAAAAAGKRKRHEQRSLPRLGIETRLTAKT